MSMRSLSAGYGSRRLLRGLALLAAMALSLFGLLYWQLSIVNPAPSRVYLKWEQANESDEARGAALFAFGDLGAIDLDTLETAGMPWPLLAAALALQEVGGAPDKVRPEHVQLRMARFGFLYPTRIAGFERLIPPSDSPLGLSIGVIRRQPILLQLTALNLGCASCHAGPAYRADGMPDPTTAVLGVPNTSLDLEAFTRASYEAIKFALQNDDKLWAAVDRLFPNLSTRERIALEWVAIPKARSRIRDIVASFDRPMPFPNGAPGLTNGVAALKHRLGVTAPDKFVDVGGFVSVPDLSDRFFRSALLVDGAYAPKGEPRFRRIERSEAAARDPAKLAAIASFFMVPSMGMGDERAADAIPELTEVMRFLGEYRPPPFPGAIDRTRVAEGRRVFARSCSNCHGTYDDSLERPRLVSFPNWSGDVGTDRSRVEAFDPALVRAVDQTVHGRRHLDAASTGVIAAPLLSGVWATAPYLTNGSVPTLRHLLEPYSRPGRFMVGGHRLDFVEVGIAGELRTDGLWAYPNGYRPFSAPVVIDTRRPGFSNGGHSAEAAGLTADERRALLEYLKLL